MTIHTKANAVGLHEYMSPPSNRNTYGAILSGLWKVCVCVCGEKYCTHLRCMRYTIALYVDE